MTKISDDRSGTNLQLRNIFETAFYKGIGSTQDLPIERAIHALCGNNKTSGITRCYNGSHTEKNV
jgi:hypothetical protein